MPFTIDNLPNSIKARITALIRATEEHAWLGSQPIEDQEAIEEGLKIARYNLERTIVTVLNQKGTKP